MRKKFLLITLAAVLLLALLSGCAPKQFTLQLKLKPNTTYQVTTHVKQHFTQKFMGQTQDITQNLDTYYNWKVNDVDEKGNFVVEITYTRVVISQNQGGKTTTYDSSKDKKPPALFAGLELLVGKHFTVVLSPSGSIVKIKGLDEMFKQIEQESGLQGKQLERFHQALTQTMGDSVIQDQFGTTFGPYTDKPLKKGSTWENDVNLNSFFPVTVHSTYTVKEWKGNKATIEVHSTIASDPNQPYKLPMFTAKYDLKGEQQGTMVINLTDGMPSKSSVKQHLEGTIHLLDPSGSESIPLPVTVDTTMEMDVTK